MPNPIKYSTGSETLALKKGNMYIGTGDVGKGPSDVTGYYQGVDVPSGGYVIYMNKEGAPGGLSYHSAANDSELIAFTNNLAGQSYTTVNECLVYFAGQSDKVVLNRDYEGIVTDGLFLNLDAGFTPSYPRNGNTWYDLSGNGNHMTLTNGVTYETTNEGILSLDGTDDYNVNSDAIYPLNDSTVSIWMYPIGTDNEGVFSIGVNGNLNSYIWLILSSKLRFYGPSNSSTVSYTPEITLDFNNWQNIVRTRDDSTGTEKTYVNGILEHTQNNWQTNTTLNTPGSISLGIELDTRLGGDTSQCYHGKYGNCLVYNRALSATEVLQNYNAQKGRFGL